MTGSSLRSPRGDEAKLLSSASTAVNIGENEARMRANGHVGVVRVGGRDGGSVGEISPGLGIGGGLGQRPDREVRRKSSRFRFDFWKKKRGLGSASTSTSPGAGIGQGGGETSP